MTNYVRQKDDHIHAGLALHAGLLLEQYGGLTADASSDDKHEATLTLAVLQMLLTNLEELFHRLEADRSKLLSTVIGDTPVWGLEQKFIQENQFPSPVRLRWVIRHLRNAVSHPTAWDKTDWPSTGYSTERDLEYVDGIRFTHSPWVEGGGPPSGRRSASSMKWFAKEWGANDDPSFQLSEHRDENGGYVVTRDGVPGPYVPVFTIAIPIDPLAVFTKELAVFLSQPVLEPWDGSIRPLDVLVSIVKSSH